VGHLREDVYQVACLECLIGLRSPKRLKIGTESALYEFCFDFPLRPLR
jgi:hypothetical protein